MILSDRLISRSCLSLSRMIGVRLPGGGAYRGAREGEAARGCPRRIAARPLPPPPYSFLSGVITLLLVRCGGDFACLFDNPRRSHEA